ncbi:MAG: hypothetical protein HYZ28_06375 [Myxococcales bacterium]|nr:hypothetical protein [Myxococcales bacterium]
MPGQRGAKDGKPDEGRHDTVRLPEFAGLEEGRSLADMHRSLALGLLGEGEVARAFSELVRACRVAPMTGRLAAMVVRTSLRAGTEAAAISLLESGQKDADGDERAAVLRQQARLLRRLGELERAREVLVLALAERPSDRRARVALNAVLQQEGRWEELDASLERETRDALAKNQLSRASRATLQRARLWGERLADHGRAGPKYEKAAQLAEEAGDVEGAFHLRLLWVRSLRESRAAPRAMEEAVEKAVRTGELLGRAERARAMAKELAREVPAYAPNAPPGSTPAPSRRQTQAMLIAAAEDAQARGRSSEAAALLGAAVQERADPDTARKLEAHYVARGAWRELAQHYRERAAKARGAPEKLEALSHLAEVLEDELHDGLGAAKVYGEIVSLSGDKQALAEQVRLLSQREDLSGVRRALDLAVERAADPKSRGNALVARAEAKLARKDLVGARADFAHALEESPGLIAARAGLAEVALQLGEAAPLHAFREALSVIPRRQPGRGEIFRRLGRMCDSSPSEKHHARAAWAEVLAELPQDAEAQSRLGELARESGDLAQLERVLRAQLKREPRGPNARQARMELVAMLERAGRSNEALAELRSAARFEPGHKEAWLALSDRLVDRSLNDEAAWALEQAATATEDEAERLRTWQRLAAFSREVLGDDARAERYHSRAENVRLSLAEQQPPLASLAPARKLPLPVAAAATIAGPITIPPPPRATHPSQEAGTDETEQTSPGDLDRHQTEELEVVAAPGEEEEWEGSTVGREYEGDEDGEEGGVLEVTTGDVVPISDEWEAPPGAMDERHKTEEIPVALGDPSVEILPSIVPAIPARKHTEDRERLFQKVRDDPLGAEAHRQLADYFDGAGDAARSGLMAEIALALEGDPNAAPRTPKLICSATDRAGLRHPALRTEAGELFALCGLALARLFPAKGKAAGSRDEFRLDAGRGAQAAADALLAGVRILGLRAPDVHLSEDNGPPFSLVFANAPRLLVGRLAAKRQLPDSELRFFAGRALFTLNPDLLSLRTLRKEQLERGMSVLASVLRGSSLSAEARAVRDSLPPKGLERIRELFERNAKSLSLRALADGARHSSNRAGLVVCGGVAPALAALRAKKALQSEIAELVRFAASERYLQLRTRRLGG